MGLQIMYVSFNQYNLMISNSGSNVYLYELETLVSSITEFYFADNDFKGDRSIPIGSTGLEEEEYHFYKKLSPFATTHPLDELYKNRFVHHQSKIKEPISKVTTPPPEV